MKKLVIVVLCAVGGLLIATSIAQENAKKEVMKTQETAPAAPTTKVEKSDAEWKANHYHLVAWQELLTGS